ncbi:hypothetical protein [uncultured Algimonas sp.]|uniref:hypothetical protein n=1 Tax=uncultured Algimonas sp. TaxID=1547920 RepID=UPI00262D6DC3|nr:hypothetical protein [uncultured Algimonas sp.]
MIRFTSYAALAALLLAPAMADAAPRGFDTTIDQPLYAPVKIEVVLSDSLVHRANNLPTELRKRGNARGLRSGFANNGFYGEKSLSLLVEEVHEELSEDFAKHGIEVSDDAGLTFRVTLEDVKNNRPTFEQLSRQPGLSFDSFGFGGAELSGELLTADGGQLGTVSYSWFETGGGLSFQFAQANGIWTDARRAISRFARKTSDALS